MSLAPPLPFPHKGMHNSATLLNTCHRRATHTGPRKRKHCQRCVSRPYPFLLLLNLNNTPFTLTLATLSRTKPLPPIGKLESHTPCPLPQSLPVRNETVRCRDRERQHTETSSTTEYASLEVKLGHCLFVSLLHHFPPLFSLLLSLPPCVCLQ